MKVLICKCDSLHDLDTFAKNGYIVQSTAPSPPSSPPIDIRFKTDSVCSYESVSGFESCSEGVSSRSLTESEFLSDYEKDKDKDDDEEGLEEVEEALEEGGEEEEEELPPPFMFEIEDVSDKESKGIAVNEYEVEESENAGVESSNTQEQKTQADIGNSQLFPAARSSTANLIASTKESEDATPDILTHEQDSRSTSSSSSSSSSTSSQNENANASYHETMQDSLAHYSMPGQFSPSRPLGSEVLELMKAMEEGRRRVKRTELLIAQYGGDHSCDGNGAPVEMEERRGRERQRRSRGRFDRDCDRGKVWGWLWR